MNKKWVLIIVMSIVLLSGIYGVLKWQKVSRTEIVEDIEIDLCAFKAEDISKIEIKDSESMVLKKVNETWQDEQKQNLNLNQEIIKQMLSQITELTSIQSIGNVQDPIVYGVTENSKIITIYNKENQAETFRIGQEAAGKSGLYIGRDSDEKIYMVPKEKMNTLLFKRADFVKAELTLPTREKITVFALEHKEDARIEFMLNTQKGYIEYDKWLLESPYKNKYEAHTQTVESYLDSIYNFSFEKFVTDEVAELSKYGLDTPAFVITLDKDFKISFGNKDGNNIYVMTSKEPYVYTMESSKLEELENIDTFKVIKKQIFTPALEQVKSIGFKNETENSELKIENKVAETKKIDDANKVAETKKTDDANKVDETNKTDDTKKTNEAKKTKDINKVTENNKIDRESLTAMLQNTALDEQTTKALFDQVTALAITHRLVNPEVEEKQEREAEVVITYTLKDNTTKQIELIPYDPSFYILRYQDTIEFAVDKKQVVELFGKLKDLIKNS